MSVVELAQKLGVAPEELFAFFEHIQHPIPHELNFELSEELIKSAEENKFFFESFSTSETGVNTGKETYEFDDRELNKWLDQSSQKLIKKIKEVNNLEFLILSGRLKKVINENYGFFEDILDTNDNNIFYPNYSETEDAHKITEIFIPDVRELKENERYFFEGELAKDFERKRKRNPYLLQTTVIKVQKAKILSELELAVKDKETALNEVNRKIDKIEDEYDNKINEIQRKEKELSALNDTFEITNNNLLKMEDLLNTLKDRVALCKNLQFLSEDDECKYLDLLSTKEFKPTNHLDFENDFEKSFSKLSDHIHAYLYYKNNLIYTRYQIRNFLTLLKTYDIIVLSGLSGSGKTQIVKAFAEALGGVAKIIPVKPNWTSSDDLIGYYNPLQMSFLPTPFTEAIVEAIHNPNQLYFICLDEMNLARAEYYFADFLSKLEERSKLPEIELYANHEEELFVSEFGTLLNLIESCIKEKKK